MLFLRQSSLIFHMRNLVNCLTLQIVDIELLLYTRDSQCFPSTNHNAREWRINSGHRPSKLWPPRPVESLAINCDISVVCPTEKIRCRETLPRCWVFRIRGPPFRTSPRQFTVAFWCGSHCSECVINNDWMPRYGFYWQRLLLTHPSSHSKLVSSHNYLLSRPKFTRNTGRWRWGRNPIPTLHHYR